jgi:hypothetical protein
LILPVSASHIARITGVNHWRLALWLFFIFSLFFVSAC